MMQTLYGHTAVETQLAGLLAAHRFPHALLFYGPKGIGKRLLAEKLAVRLVCGRAQAVAGPADMFGEPRAAENVSLEPDTTAPQWHQIAAGSCPDFYVLTPEEGKKSIGIKQVQTLLEALLRSADTARTVIVDSLEDLTPEAANTLLKTLEEPRPGVYFLLVAHQLSAVLPTIRSRCRLMPLSPLEKSDVEAVLREAGVDPTLAEVAVGCPGMVMGEAAAQRRALQQALEEGRAAGAPVSPYFLETLARHMLPAKGHAPTLAETEAYQSILALQGKAAALNLPAALVQEAAVALYQKTRREM